ncbi:MAG: MBOAT family protein [Clostridia bacterium]|nr:MBOAT family protein [Clostridia bacterium]
MVFSSATFLFLFLPFTLVLYHLKLFRNKERETGKKNLVLLIMSLIFYAWGEPVYIILMLLSIVYNYNAAIDIDSYIGSPKKKKLVFICALIFNLSVLGFFKYYGFLTESINSIFSLSLPVREIPLPVGISFYTFQVLSYIIDVYRGDVKAQKSIIPFATYISMFPQLIAGPIVQYYDVEKQLTDREVTAEKFAAGIMFFIKGLGKKVIFANTVGAVCTEIFGMETASLSVLTSWIGIICYTLQIYFDFSGYSDMAIGLGKMLGFDFIQNFNFPYKATSITDFWRRWHISLSSWFRDYVYIPLGGNRRGTARNIFNLLVVWSLTGLWHGAAWNFIVWGIFYGVLLIAEKYIFARVLERVPVFIRYIMTMVTVMVGWVFFSAENLSSAVNYLKSMFGLYGNGFADSTAEYLLSENFFSLAVMILCATGVFAALPRIKNFRFNIALMSAGYIVIFIICIIYLISETYNPFLYFRF